MEWRERRKVRRIESKGGGENEGEVKKRENVSVRERREKGKEGRDQGRRRG